MGICPLEGEVQKGEIPCGIAESAVVLLLDHTEAAACASFNNRTESLCVTDSCRGVVPPEEEKETAEHRDTLYQGDTCGVTGQASTKGLIFFFFSFFRLLKVKAISLCKHFQSDMSESLKFTK